MRAYGIRLWRQPGGRACQLHQRRFEHSTNLPEHLQQVTELHLRWNAARFPVSHTPMQDDTQAM